ncbi:hypothetical protein PDG61_20405 [Mycolicibacterium sp. BiH015]|uniref:uridine kinase family protein n=1 Tax=Mycolicibacterium sp. BiH015 TaxID=3018808 RepID=UPI0022E5E91E|nr:hypothetical protein [Mycolicibacterium sp. BiH015]MDA2893290.1 hypothetical protein [Mycolicibacterium sp. BiH015]
MNLNDNHTARMFASDTEELWNELRRYRRHGRPLVVAIDGVSGSGKTQLAAGLAGHDPHTSVIHMDDIAWNHTFFDWRHLLIDGLLEPLHDGLLPVSYQPQGWRHRGRSGAISIPATAHTVIVEGVGSAARDVRRLLDVVIWIDVDDAVARERVAARGNDTVEFIAEWESQEREFLAAHRPWEIADILVDGRGRSAPNHLNISGVRS